jgi:Na+/H+ antiporter NhaC
MSRSGGTAGIVNLLVKYAKGRRSAQVITWFMGLVIFFDDYANTLLVGNTMRPITDKLKVSREKLSYIVDSTAAPVACLAVISTWVGYEISLIRDASVTNNLLNMDAYIIFIKSIPYRFYNLYTLGMVFFIAWSGRDFGPMLKAEQRVVETGMVNGPDASPLSSTKRHQVTSNLNQFQKTTTMLTDLSPVILL